MKPAFSDFYCYLSSKVDETLGTIMLSLAGKHKLNWTIEYLGRDLQIDRTYYEWRMKSMQSHPSHLFNGNSRPNIDVGLRKFRKYETQSVSYYTFAAITAKVMIL